MIVVGVLSCAKYSERRDACRNTWFGEMEARDDLVPLFIVGGYEGPDPYRIDGDTLHLPCPDDYNHLTHKTRGFCSAALDAYPEATHLFKADDDTYVAADRLAEYDRQGWHYIGRNPGGDFRYASGGAGYFLSRCAAELVAEQLTSTVWSEDLEVGKIMQANGVYFYDESRFGAWRKDARPSPWNDRVTAHYVVPEEMRAIHQTLLSHA